MNVLVATRNKDKYEIVRAILADAVSNVVPIFLGDTILAGEVDEVGTLEERALQKAKFYAGAGTETFDAVLGIDDGMQVGDSEPTANSKEFTDRVLGGEWSKGTRIYIVRAFGLVKATGESKTTVTKLPFTFLGNDAGVTREETKYPLSKVFAQEDGAVPVSDMSPEESKVFDSKYSRTALKELFS